MTDTGTDGPATDRRLAVVTGAASGVGMATVVALRAAGTAVIGVDLQTRPDELDGDVGWVQGDIVADATWERVQQEVLARDPRGADCLVASAADVIVGPFLDTSIDAWRRVLDINLLGTIRAMQTLMPAMIERGDGAVAVVCSMNSIVTEVEAGAYSTTKAALLHAVRSAALEHAAAGLQINAVLPGCVDTPLLRRHLDATDDPEGMRRALERRTPVGRLLRPEEIASVLRFLVSRDASAMSGAAVVVDGGITTTYDFDAG